jgi:hypothetical protein
MMISNKPKAELELAVVRRIAMRRDELLIPIAAGGVNHA